MLVRKAHEIEWIRKIYNAISPIQFQDMIELICEDRYFIFNGFVGEWNASYTKIQLICKYGHEWITNINDFKNAGHGCPSCSGRKTKHDRLTQVQTLCKKENISMLGIIGVWKGIHTKIKLMCEHGHVWTPTITNFINMGTRCKKCSIYGFKPTLRGTFYIQKLKSKNKLEGVKFGITNKSSQKRMNQQEKNSKFDHEIFYELTLQDGQKILELENKIKEAMKGKTSYISKEDMPDGYTETVAPSELSTIMYIVKSFEKELTA